MNKKMRAIMNQKPLEDDMVANEASNAADDEAPPVAGNWARIAYREDKKSLSSLREGLYEGVISGRVPIVLKTDQITDEIGSDRVVPDSDEPNDPASLSALRENISKRGQRTPIRVRPADPDWKPNKKSPQSAPDTEFLLLSGRRRLQACRDLNTDVIALVDFTRGDTPAEIRLEDLQERYFENVSRKDLNSFEKLASIGLMAQTLGDDKTHNEIAELLHTSRSTVSKGLKVVEYYDEILELIIPAQATYEQITQAIAACSRRGENTPEETSAPSAAATISQDSNETPTQAPKPAVSQEKSFAPHRENAPEPFKEKRIGHARLSLSNNSKGISTLKIYTDKLDNQTLAKIEEILAEGAGS